VKSFLQQHVANFESPKSLKRGVEEANIDQENRNNANDDNEDEESDDDDLGDIIIDENCDQVRRKINRLIDSGEVKVKDFMDAIHSSSVSYYRFMKQHGKDKGSQSSTYVNAFRYFKRREAKGIPLPKKRKIVDPKTADSKSGATSKNSAGADISDVLLDGEEDDAVPVYDSCDEIRRKINAYMRKPGVTQAQFLRDLHAQFSGPRKPRSLQGTQLAKFRGQNGAMTGNTSGIYYAAYVFFEKQRLAMKHPKTKHRLDMEDAWAVNGGVDVCRNLNNQHYIVAAGETVYIDNLGQVGFGRRG
jgi:hypothetical protein